MATVDTHTPGSFCWIELGTTDQNAAKQFYGPLLGWTAEDFPMGPSSFYTMFSLAGRNTAGCYSLTHDMTEHGLPPHWLLYIAVANADESAAKITRSGGSIMKAPFDLMEFGRMSVCQDPTGAIFALWQPKMHKGSGIEGVPGTLTWADLITNDQARAVKFYSEVFGWQADSGKDNSGYQHIKNGDKHIGGIPPAGPQTAAMPPHWLLYFLTENCDASTAKAKETGAKIVSAPETMEGVGRWSIITDPQGATFALFQSTH
jgi:predicted enzyme related to lactoylglutathione lyase